MTFTIGELDAFCRLHNRSIKILRKKGQVCMANGNEAYYTGRPVQFSVGGMDERPKCRFDFYSPNKELCHLLPMAFCPPMPIMDLTRKFQTSIKYIGGDGNYRS